MKEVSKIFGESITHEQAQYLFQKADANQDGMISFDEFVLASMDQDKLHNE